jgi:HIRAN domain
VNENYGPFCLATFHDESPFRGRERRDSRGLPSCGSKRLHGKLASEPALKLNACLVHAGGLLGIVGESYRQDELRALSRRTTDAGRFRADLAAYAAEVADDEPDRRWFLAVLVREPDNPKDPEAVAVHAEGGGKLGYLNRDDARRYAQVFRSLEKRGYDAAACPAMLNGGGEKSFGVVLAISAPGPILNDLTSSDL